MARNLLKRDSRDGARGQAEQLDFLNAMMLLLVGIIFFFGFSAVVFGIGIDSNLDGHQESTNADSRLVEDLLLEDVRDIYLDRDCTDDYFGMAENASCGISGFNVSAPNETHWLQHSLGIDDSRQANITITDGSDIATNASGTQYALGKPVPGEADVYESSRYVSFDGSRYYIVYVRVWQNG